MRFESCSSFLLTAIALVAALPSMGFAEQPPGRKPVAVLQAAHPFLYEGETFSGLGGRYVLADTLFAEVVVAVGFDASDSLYAYSYEIKNLADSDKPLEIFGVRPLSSEPVEIEAPEHWKATIGYAGDSTLVWMIDDLGPPPEDWVDDGVNVYTSTYAVLPGGSLAGFRFKSRLPPGQGWFIASLWWPLLDISEEGFDLHMPFFKKGARGYVLVPRHDATYPWWMKRPGGRD
jgi:hypothetical protein